GGCRNRALPPRAAMTARGRRRPPRRCRRPSAVHSPSCEAQCVFTTASGQVVARMPHMHLFEWIIVLLVGAVILTAFARYLKLPYPSMLALGGVALAFVPNSPEFRLDPQLTLALFVAPVLLDAAFDTSLRDLRRFWVPIAALVIIAVGITTFAVAWLARALVPGMPWAAAIALGAI